MNNDLVIVSRSDIEDILQLNSLEYVPMALRKYLNKAQVVDGEQPFYNSVVAGQLLLIRDELAKGDLDEAYHLLYSIADPSFTSRAPWEHMETVAKSAAKKEGV